MAEAAEKDDGIITCDACPVLCRIRPEKTGACDRYGNVAGVLTRMDPLVVMQRAPAFDVIPAKAGTHARIRSNNDSGVGARLRGHDAVERVSP